MARRKVERWPLGSLVLLSGGKYLAVISVIRSPRRAAFLRGCYRLGLFGTYWLLSPGHADILSKEPWDVIPIDDRRERVVVEVPGMPSPLAPAYDLNPMPVDVKPRHHALTLDEDDDRSSLETALRVAGYFGLKLADARVIAAEVGTAVLPWRDVAAAHGLTGTQVERMASAFEHEDLALAVG